MSGDDPWCNMSVMYVRRRLDTYRQGESKRRKVVAESQERGEE